MLSDFRRFLMEGTMPQTGNIVVFYGRFNPPHVGHLGVVRKLAAQAKEEEGEAIISLSGSVDAEKNPLDFETKKKYVKLMCKPYGVTVAEDPCMKVYDLIRDCAFLSQQRGGGTVTLLAGSDRVPAYQGFARSLLKKYQARGEILDVNVVVKEAMARDSDEAFSASQMRAFIKNGDVNGFIEHAPFDDKEAAEQMFKDVAKGMGIEESVTRKTLNDLLGEAHISHEASDVRAAAMEMGKQVSEHTNELTGEPDHLWFIGGCVRDEILGKTPNDFDLITTMYYKTYAALFNTTDIRFRGKQIIVVPIVAGEEFETACLHKGEKIEDNLQFRDLTMNAMAQDLATGEIVDPCGGQKDMKAHKLNLTNFMKEAMASGGQPVAVLRAIRFYSTYGWDFTADSMDTLKKFSAANKGVLKVTPRQFDKDWQKLIKGQNVQGALDLIKELGFHDYLVKSQPQYASYVNGDTEEETTEPAPEEEA